MGDETRRHDIPLTGGIAPNMTREEAIAFINSKIPPEIRERMGGFVRAFTANMADGRQTLFMELEGGYLVYFYNPETKDEKAIYLSPEVAYSFGFLYALFSKPEDETAFWAKLDPEQAAKINEALEMVEASNPPTPEIVFTALLLVEGETSQKITQEFVDLLDANQREEAYNWAMAIHFLAGDNLGVKVPPRPDFLPPPRVGGFVPVNDAEDLVIGIMGKDAREAERQGANEMEDEARNGTDLGRG